MIGSHDSMTYLRARWLVMELFASLWRTQTKSLAEQAMSGVRYFDIRVRKVKYGWRLCHGLVDFDKSFVTLGELVKYVRDCASLCLRHSTAMQDRSSHGNSLQEVCTLQDKLYIRLILERGNSMQFEMNAARLAERFPEISFIAVKRGWKVLLDRDPEMEDLTFTPWLSDLSFRENMKRLWNKIRSGEPMSIASNARHMVETYGDEIARYENGVCDDCGKIFFCDRV